MLVSKKKLAEIDRSLTTTWTQVQSCQRQIHDLQREIVSRDIARASRSCLCDVLYSTCQCSEDYQPGERVEYVRGRQPASWTGTVIPHCASWRVTGREGQLVYVIRHHDGLVVGCYPKHLRLTKGPR